MIYRKVAILTTFITPYGLPLMEALSERIQALQILLSTKMEPNRNWDAVWGNLDVKLQKTITFPRKWNHPQGFTEVLFIHFPYSTFSDLHSFKPDVVISVELGFRTFASFVYKFFSRRTKVIIWALVSEHTEKNRGKLRQFIRKIFLRNADAVLVNGKSGERYISSFGVNSKKIFFAPYTTNIKPFLKCESADKNNLEIKLLYVGQLTQRKGILLFINSLNDWAKDHPNQRIVFDVVGEGSLRNELELIKTTENLTIYFRGSVAYQDLPNIYSQRNLFVFPTLADEWGVVVNEAMAAGLPVLGSRYSQAVDELIKDNINGFVFSPDNIDDMYHSIDKACCTPHQKLIEMGQNNRLKILSLTPELQAEKIIKAIEFVR